MRSNSNVDAVGIAGGDAARTRAARVRGLAARMRDLDITVAADRWNTLVGGVSAEIDASNALHRRATEARDAADRAVVGDVDRVMETLYAAATRLARQSSPRGGGARGAGGTDVADAAADRTDAALRAAVDAAREGLEALRAHIVEALTSVQDVSADEVAGAATAALAAAPEPAEDFEGWVRALNAAVRAVEQAAADAEAAARGSESWFSRASSCIDAEARATAAVTRVSCLTVGDDRPRYVPVRAGREAYADLVVLMDAAQRRARAACRSIEQPR